MLVLEHVVASRTIFEGEGVCGEEAGVQLAFACVIEESVHVLLTVLLRCFHGQPFVHDDADGEFVHHAVNSEDRQRPPFPDGHDRLS